MTTPAIGTGDFTPGVAFNPADVNLDSQALVSVPAASTVTLGAYLTTQPAYAMLFDALGTLATAVPTCSLQFNWLDPATLQTVTADRWFPPVTTSGTGLSNALTTGRGPTKSGQVQVQVHNYDPTNPMTIDWRFWQSSRIVTRDDWRTLSLASPASPLLAPSLAPESNVLGWVANAAIPATTTSQWLATTYAGQARLHVNTGTVAGISLQVLVPFGNVGSGSWPILFQIPALAAEQSMDLALPRCPVVISIDNTTAGAVNVSWSLTATEFAS